MLTSIFLHASGSDDQASLLQVQKGRHGLESFPSRKVWSTDDTSDCSTSADICTNLDGNSDSCLQSRVDWGASATCSAHKVWCKHPYYGRDMIDCCPGLCNADRVVNSPKKTPLKQCFRASILHFTGDPWLADTDKEQFETFEYISDGYILVEDGQIRGRGAWNRTWDKQKRIKRDGEKRSWRVIDYTGRLIVPGFVDTHIHAPQTEILAAFGESLIPWLETYTFPAEAKYSDYEYAQKRYQRFVQELLRAGTTTALAFSTRHPRAADALFEAFSKYNMRSIGGKVLMDDPVNAPEILRDPSAQESIDATEDLILRWHNKGRNLYAITPRFAPTSTLKQMNLTGELMKKYPDVYMHTHLSESMGEISWVNWQFGGKVEFGADKDRLVQGERREDASGYLSVYDHFGMLGPKSIFAHSIHLSDAEWKRLGETESTVSWCPTSNHFLGSGLFNAAQAVKNAVRFGMCTDVGAGTSFSMLRTMNDGYKALKLGESWVAKIDPALKLAGIELGSAFCKSQPNWPECGVPANDKVLSAARSFYTATLGGAKQLSIDDKIGNFETGKEADFVVLNWAGGREFVGDRMSDAYLTGGTEIERLQEKLFVLMMMGDDRHVEATYVYGNKVFPFLQH